MAIDDLVNTGKMILSAGIVDRGGVIYVARQYSEMTKSKVEALYTAFPRLIQKGKQHTVIETNEIRYIYQPINDFYSVLLTDKHSNILEDIKTLRLVVGAINEYASLGKGLVTEDSITRSRFDLLFVFDEIICMGVRQIDNLAQLRTVMEMKSEEEKAFMESLTRKEKEAKAKSAEKAKELDQQRRNEMLLQSDRSLNRGISSGISSSSKISEPVVVFDVNEVEKQQQSKPARVMSRGKALKLKSKS